MSKHFTAEEEIEEKMRKEDMILKRDTSVKSRCFRILFECFMLIIFMDYDISIEIPRKKKMGKTVTLNIYSIKGKNMNGEDVIWNRKEKEDKVKEDLGTNQRKIVKSEVDDDANNVLVEIMNDLFDIDSINNKKKKNENKNLTLCSFKINNVELNQKQIEGFGNIIFDSIWKSYVCTATGKAISLNSLKDIVITNLAFFGFPFYFQQEQSIVSETSHEMSQLQQQNQTSDNVSDNTLQLLGKSKEGYYVYIYQNQFVIIDQNNNMIQVEINIDEDGKNFSVYLI